MVSKKSGKMNIPVARPLFGASEERLAVGVVRSGWVGQGRMVRDFEGMVARYTGAGYAVAVSSGTAALHLALLCAGVKPGDEVIVPSFSFIATANAVVYCGARPVFADIDLDTYNISVEEIQKCIKKRGRKIKAIMPVHQFGLPCDIDAVSIIARKHGLKLVEDAACALGSSYKGFKIGKKSGAAAFSFHPRKILTTGEGGIIVTNNAAVCEKMRQLRNHGLCRGDHKSLGYNYRLTDLQAALGVAQLEKLDQILRDRRALAQRYDEVFEESDFIRTPAIPSYAHPNYQSYVIRVEDRCPVSRDALLSRLLKYGISARKGNTSIHLQAFYRKKGLKLPNTEKASRTTIALPLYPGMRRKEQDFVADKVISILRGKA